MPEGSTTVLCAKDENDCVEHLLEHVRRLDVGEIRKDVLRDKEFIEFRFEHNGLYSDARFTKIVKSLCRESGCRFLRAVHSDEYGQEIFWVCKDGKYNKYQLDEDSEGPGVVKAYRHFHSGLDGLWLGTIAEESIDIMSERYGQYDENGRKIKSRYEDYTGLIGTGSAFLRTRVRAPYASSKWDCHVPVYESFARYYAEKCPCPPKQGTFSYRRSFYFPDLLGFAWTWRNKGHEIVLLLTFPGTLGMDRNLVVNVDELSLDHIIILDHYGCLSGRVPDGHDYDFNQHVETHDPFDNEQILPPSTDYLHRHLTDWLGTLRKEGGFDGVTVNISCELVRNDDGSYFSAGYMDSGGKFLVRVNDMDFCRHLDELPAEKYSEIDFYDHDTSRSYRMKVIYCELQAEFNLDLNIRKVLKGRAITYLRDPDGKVKENVLASWP